MGTCYLHRINKGLPQHVAHGSSLEKPAYGEACGTTYCFAGFEKYCADEAQDFIHFTDYFIDCRIGCARIARVICARP